MDVIAIEKEFPKMSKIQARAKARDYEFGNVWHACSRGFSPRSVPLQNLQKIVLDSDHKGHYNFPQIGLTTLKGVNGGESRTSSGL